MFLQEVINSSRWAPRYVSFAGLVALGTALFSVVACDHPPKSLPSSEAAAPLSTSSNEKADVKLSQRISRPAADRIVAIGDLHGDFEVTRRVLRLAGAIDSNDAWIGGKLTVVQTGDEIDRGDGDRKIVDLIEKLKEDSKKAGGELIALTGNHELMNAQFDFRYVTLGGFAGFNDIAPKNDVITARIADIDANAKGRAAAFAPGGPYAALLANRPIVMKVGDDVFVHGGILPKHLAYGLDKMNDEVSDWLLAKTNSPPSAVIAEDGPVWTRLYSAAPGKEECDTLKRALSAMGAKRMIVGHTVQREGVTSACDGNVWRVDVGLSKFFGGPVQALEIKGDAVTVLKEGS